MKPISKFAARLTEGNADRVKDLAAKTFVRAWEAWATFPGQGDEEQERKWLITICRNLFYDELRQESGHGELISLDAVNPRTGTTLGDQIKALHSTEEQASRHICIDCIKQALDSTKTTLLPAVVIEVGYSYYLGGLTQEEIAKKWKITQSNVSQHLIKVRQYLVKTCGDLCFS